MRNIPLGAARQEGLVLLRCASADFPVKQCIEKDVFVPTETPALDVDCILAHVAEIPREYVLAHPEATISPEQYDRFLKAIALRRQGLPVAYITGVKEFYGYDFYVTPDVLVPKPDTELLVEQAVHEIKELALKKDACLNIADVCTGSGCVAISVAKTLEKLLPSCRFKMFATDISEKALEVAKRNCSFQKCNVQLFQGDLLLPLIDVGIELDILLGNPPYVPASVAKELLSDGRNEPMLALNGDCNGTQDGTGLIQRLIPQIPKVLCSGGCALIETGEYNAQLVANFFLASGFIDVRIFNDLAGLPRLVQAKKN